MKEIVAWLLSMWPIIALLVGVIAVPLTIWVIKHDFDSKKKELVGIQPVAKKSKSIDRKILGISYHKIPKQSPNDTKYQEKVFKLTNALNAAKTEALAIHKLDAATDITSVLSDGRGQTVFAREKYKAAEIQLKSMRTKFTIEHRANVDSLIFSLQHGNELLRNCQNMKNISRLKPELNKNSEDIISQIDDILEMVKGKTINQ